MAMWKGSWQGSKNKQKCALCGEPCSPSWPDSDLCDTCLSYTERMEEQRAVEQVLLEADQKLVEEEVEEHGPE
jgi:hypothetical protein